jgi:MFS family permease
VFVPFVAAYYIAYLFRTINAVMAVPLTTELGLAADDLGLLTSVYFLTFAAAQIPIGILLDRYGPRRIQSVLLVVAAIGSGLFATSENFWMLLAGRALIGLGVASALTAGLKALVLWFPGERVPLFNGLMVMLGALGAVTATLPADLLVDSIGWRELFALFSALSFLSAALVYLVVPEAKPAANRAFSLSLKNVYADSRFWRSVDTCRSVIPCLRRPRSRSPLCMHRHPARPCATPTRATSNRSIPTRSTKAPPTPILAKSMRA